MIIYPPLIADTIPAFLYGDTEVVITVPFTQNPAVPVGIPLQIQIKDYFSSTVIAKSQTAQQAIEGQVSFSFKANEVDSWPIRTTVNGKTYRFPVVGQYYKIQIAYDDGDEGVELTYSSAVLGKCIDNHINLSITDINKNILSTDINNTNPIVYVGNYIRNQLNEPLYSYQFDFKDQIGNVLESSGEIIWDNEQDIKYTIENAFVDTLSQSLQHWKTMLQSINPTLPYSFTLKQYTDDRHSTLKASYVFNFNKLKVGNVLYTSSIVILPEGDYSNCTIDDGFEYFMNVTCNLGQLEKEIYVILQSRVELTEEYKNYPSIKSIQALMFNFKSTPIYHLKYEPQTDQTYTMTFSTTTINGYQDSVSVDIIKGVLKEPNFPVELEIISNKDMGNNEIRVEVEKYAIKERSTLQVSSSATLGIVWDGNQPASGSFYPINFLEDNIVTNQKYSNLIGNIKINNNIFYTDLKLTDGNSWNDFIVIKHKSNYLPQGEYTIKFTNFYYFSNNINQPYISFDSMEMSLDNTNQLGVIIRQHNGINEAVSTNLSYNDNTITFGETYKYGWQENYQGPTKIQWHEPSITTYTDYMFLSDKDKQLKISFNPKVSNMKETILETKQDTIGGKYPIFYRNGQVRYREIPISGLISYLMDDYEQFATSEELGLAAPDTARTTSLTDYNIVAERKFREKVLNWLNDGKPKLFRSMTEGTFIVRLMNVSLSPNDTVGRMIWTFSATAYEIAENTYDNLKKYKLVETEEEE